jgi:hypothetical protein
VGIASIRMSVEQRFAVRQNYHPEPLAALPDFRRESPLAQASHRAVACPTILIVRQPVKLVDEAVYLPVCCSNQISVLLNVYDRYRDDGRRRVS